MYNRNWAREVVKAHYKRYARASYLILVSSHFTQENLALWLAKSDGDPILRARWEFFKTLARKLTQELDQRLPPDTKQVFSKLSRSILGDVFWSFDRWGPDWLLTEWRWWADHEEQFLKARPAAALAPAKAKDRLQGGLFDPPVNGADQAP